MKLRASRPISALVDTITRVTNPLKVEDTEGTQIDPATEGSVKASGGFVADPVAVALDTTGEALTDMSGRLVMLQADPDNDANILWGNANAQVFELEPGQITFAPFTNSNLIKAKAKTGTQTLNYGVLV